MSICADLHNLPCRRAAREKRSLDDRAHLHRLWRRLVKKTNARFTEEEEKEYDETKIVKSGVSRFSRGLETRTVFLAIWIARYRLVSNF